MSRTINAAEAKTRFAESLRLVEAGEIVEITRYGKAVAALVGVEQVAQLRRLQIAGPMAGLGGLIGRFADGEELAAELDRVAESRSPSRSVPDFEE